MKEENIESLHQQINTFQEARNSEKSEVKGKINELLDALANSRTTVTHLESQASLAREREHEARRLLEDRDSEVENLTKALSTVNEQLTSRESELNIALKA